jgi:hypothetical protein
MIPPVYRRWFRAAVIYNLAWGLSVALYPAWFLWFANLGPAAAPLAQAVGMMVGVYAYGYFLLARDPERYASFVWIALAGKMLGPAGYLASAFAGALPWRFGWINVTNDLVWLPVFWSFALKYARAPGRRDSIE